MLHTTQLPNALPSLLKSTHCIWLVRLHHERVAGGAAVLRPVHDHHKAVGGRLGPDVQPRIVPTQQKLDECRLAGRVLAEQQDTGLGLKVPGREQRREKVTKLVRLLQRADLWCVCWGLIGWADWCWALGTGYVAFT